MSNKRGTLPAFVWIGVLVLPCLVQTKVMQHYSRATRSYTGYTRLSNAKEILSRLDACGPDNVGNECASLHGLWYTAKPFKRSERYGDLPVPQDRRRFYRCRGDVVTVKDCGKNYFFDPKRRYCVPEMKETTKENKTKPAEEQAATAVISLPPPNGWVCTGQVPTSDWDSTTTSMDQCWKKALALKSAVLVVGPSGCQHWPTLSIKVSVENCSSTSIHVLQVGAFRKDLTRLRPESEVWITAKRAAGVTWQSVDESPVDGTTLPDCVERCMKIASDFARVESQGCSCGEQSGPSAAVHHEDVHFGRTPLADVDPGFTLRVRFGRADCPLSKADSAADKLPDCDKQLKPNATERLRACAFSRRLKRRLTRAGCEKRKAFTIKNRSLTGLTSEHARNIKTTYLYREDLRLWWVSKIPLRLVWRSPGYVTTLEGCMEACTDRFVIAGPMTCACGSLKEDDPEVDVETWVEAQSSKPLSPGEGFLLHDREAFVNGISRMW
ncbi:uncharacterized protein LOC119102699 [Pollicipes pollicipes]|uniref:uncharacterized protein LOC119102699 n=1 Tax=Pollicipes pollicipes TaxID=41117 RepID=UPI0018859514|nr:uncharacterized protein LOC119102699 [Pollicipes pollicipes]